MSLRNRISLIVLWALSIVIAGALVQAQAPSTGVPGRESPTIVSGGDLGFRIERWKGGTPIGALLVRVDGQWVEVEYGVGVKRLTTR